MGFADLLLLVRPAVGYDWTLLAELGIILRRFIPDFGPERFGGAKLTALLEAHPEFGELKWSEDGHPSYRFYPPEEGETAHAPIPVRLDGRVWKAVIDFTPPEQGWLFDLATHEVTSPEADAVEFEPERFLQLPQADEDFQQRIAQEFVTEHCPELIAAVEAALAEPGWHRKLRYILGDELWSSLGDHRQGVISRLVLDWADSHGIQRSHVARPASPRRSHNSSPSNLARATSPALGTRAALHELIDLLSDAELQNFPIPAWCLARMAAPKRE